MDMDMEVVDKVLRQVAQEAGTDVNPANVVVVNTPPVESPRFMVVHEPVGVPPATDEQRMRLAASGVFIGKGVSATYADWRLARLLRLEPETEHDS